MAQTPGDTGATLARFIVGSDPGHVPEKVRREANRALVNVMGAALGGCRDAAVVRLAEVFTALGGHGGCGLIGRRERLDPVRAAVVNAAAANALDFDDAHPATVIHPAACVAAAAFACAGLRRVAGADFLDALAIGIEATCRLGLGLGPRHYANGFHITATCGAVGAAATAARLLELDERRTLNALGIAANRAGGLVANLNHMAKSAGVGGAAGDGVWAALLAEAGMEAAPAALDGDHGFLAVLGPDGRAAPVVEGLGEAWEVLANTYKQYPTGVVLNPVIAACLALRGFLEGTSAEIASIEIRGSDLLVARADRPHVATTRDAKLSAQHAAAAALVRGACGLAEFAPEAIRDSAVARMRALVTVAGETSFGIEQAEVAIRLADGRVVTRRVDDPPGGSRRPLTDSELSRKFRDLCAFAGSDVDADALLAALWDAERTDDVGVLLALASPRSGASGR